MLTDTGKKRLVYFILILLASMAVYGGVFLMGWAEDLMTIFIIILPVSTYYFWLFNLLHLDIEKSALAQINFSHIADAKGLLSDYKVSSLPQFKINSAYESSNPEYGMTKLANFEVTVGSGKNSTTYTFTGIEFHTHEQHRPVQIFDQTHPLKPWFGKKSVESSEFHKLFEVYADDAKDPYYQLDPDTMSDLMDLRNSLQQPINIEFTGQKVFLYTNRIYYRNGGLYFSPTKILNGTGGEADIASYLTSVKDFLGTASRIFAALDLKLRAIKQKNLV